jgi:UDP-2,4-diacetamido-2,4,6-trideoxy-beta-L-altropyranose hydrolase
MAQPQIFFRADASLQIGTGHVVRCLTLAKALRASGAECTFLTRALDGHLADRIKAEGFTCDLLPAPDGTAELLTDPPHAYWAGVPWQTDAAECAAILQGRSVDWLIMDHYAFDHRWQSVLRPHVSQIMVWDDLADRKHDCDLLLDQNLGTSAQDYDGLVPDTAHLLIGPKYAQLRGEFASQRAEALVSRSNRRLQKILIAMGGVDQHDATGRLLDALALWPQAPSLDVSVVLGGKAPHLPSLRAKSAELPFRCEIATDVTDMGHRMAEADLAIGAVGGTTWERCALGLPALLLVIANNQLMAADAIERVGAAVLLGRADQEGWERKMLEELERLRSPEKLFEISQKAAAICDGLGTQRLLQTLSQFDGASRGDA